MQRVIIVCFLFNSNAVPLTPRGDSGGLKDRSPVCPSVLYMLKATKGVDSFGAMDLTVV